MTSIPLVMLLDIIFSIQTHLVKKLKRHGIAVFDQIKARMQWVEILLTGGKKPLTFCGQTAPVTSI